MEVMHERNAHNFPLDLAAAESTCGSASSRHRLIWNQQTIQIN